MCEEVNGISSSGIKDNGGRAEQSGLNEFLKAVPGLFFSLLFYCGSVVLKETWLLLISAAIIILITAYWAYEPVRQMLARRKPNGITITQKNQELVVKSFGTKRAAYCEIHTSYHMTTRKSKSIYFPFHIIERDRTMIGEIRVSTGGEPD